MVSADPIIEPVFVEKRAQIMQTVYQILVRELELEAMKLRRQLEEKRRRVKQLQRMA